MKAEGVAHCRSRRAQHACEPLSSEKSSVQLQRPGDGASRGSANFYWRQHRRWGIPAGSYASNAVLMAHGFFRNRSAFSVYLKRMIDSGSKESSLKGDRTEGGLPVSVEAYTLLIAPPPHLQ